MKTMKSEIKRMRENPPEFTDNEIEAMKELWPDWQRRRSFFGYHLRAIIEHKANPENKLTLYHITSQWAIKNYIKRQVANQ